MGNKKISLPVSGVTNSIVNELMDMDTNGVIRKDTARLFKSYKGRKVQGKQYSDIATRMQGDIGSKELSNFYINAAKKYVTTKSISGGDRTLTMSASDIKPRNWFMRQLHKTYRGVTGFAKMKETSKTAESNIVKKASAELGNIKIPEYFSSEQKEWVTNLIKRWENAIEDLVHLEMRSYRTGTGLQKLQLHKLLRITGLVDKLIDCAKSDVEHFIRFRIAEGEEGQEENPANNILADLQIMLNVMKEYKKQGGMHRVHNFVSNLHKRLQNIDEQDFRGSINGALPSVPNVLQTMLVVFAKETSLQYSQQELLKLEVVKQLDSLIERLPAPVTTAVEKEVLDARMAVIKSLGVEDAIKVLEPAPQINHSAPIAKNKEYDKNAVFAKQLIATLEAVTRSFNGIHTDVNASEALYLRSMDVVKTEPETFKKLQYIQSIHRVLQQPETIKINMNVERKSFPKPLTGEYLALKERLLALQIKRFEELPKEKAVLYEEADKEVLEELYENVVKEIQSVRVTEIASVLQKELGKTSLNKHSIRFQRFRSGLRKTFLSRSTVASKVVRRAVGTTATVGAIASGVGLGIAGGTYLSGLVAYNAIIGAVSNAEAIALAAGALATAVQTATTIGIIGGAGAGASIAGLALACSSTTSTMKNTALYEDFAYVRNNEGYLVEKSSKGKGGVGNTAILSKGVTELPPFEDYIVEANFLDNNKPLSQQDFLTRIKYALQNYLPVNSTEYPTGFITQLLKLCEDLDNGDANNRWHMYTAIFYAISFYLDAVKRPEVAISAYQELSALLSRDEDVFLVEGDYSSKDERLNFNLLKQIIDEGVASRQAELTQISEEDNNVNIYPSLVPAPQIISPKDMKNTEALLAGIEKEIIHYTSKNLTKWQKEFTPEILEKMCENATPEEIRANIHKYMDKWLSQYDYYIPGFILYMLLSCEKMNTKAFQVFLVEGDDGYTKMIRKPVNHFYGKVHRNGLEYNENAEHVIIQSIIEYIGNIPSVTQDKKRAKNIVEAVQGIHHNYSKDAMLKNGILSHIQSTLLPYAIGNNAWEENISAIYKNAHIHSQNIYHPYVSDILGSLQELWNSINGSNLSNIDYNVTVRTTKLHLELERAMNIGYSNTLDTSLVEFNDIFTNPVSKEAFVAFVEQEGAPEILYSILEKIQTRISTEHNASAKIRLIMASTAIVNAIASLMQEIEQEIEQETGENNLLLLRYKTLLLATLHCDNTVFMQTSVERVSIETLLDKLILKKACMDCKKSFNLGALLSPSDSSEGGKDVSQYIPTVLDIEHVARDFYNNLKDSLKDLTSMRKRDPANAHERGYERVTELRLFLDKLLKNIDAIVLPDDLVKKLSAEKSPSFVVIFVNELLALIEGSDSGSFDEELAEALIRVLCTDKSINNRQLQLGEAVRVAINLVDYDTIVAPLVDTLNNVYTKVVSPVIKERAGHLLWETLRAENIKIHIASEMRKNLTQEQIFTELWEEIESLLIKYLPQDSSHYLRNFVLHLLDVIEGIDAPLNNYDGTGGMYYSAGLIEQCIQYFLNITVDTVREQALQALLKKYYAQDDHIILSCFVDYEVKPEKGIIQTKILPTFAKANEILLDMLSHVNEFSTKKVSQSEISPNKAVKEICTSIEEITRTLQGIGSSATPLGNAPWEFIFNVGILPLLEKISSYNVSERLQNSVKATPFIYDLLTNFITAVSSVIEHVTTRREGYVLQKILNTILPYTSIAGRDIQYLRKVDSYIATTISLLPTGCEEVINMDQIKSLLFAIEKGGHTPKELVKEIQSSLNMHFPQDSNMACASTEVFEAFLYEILSLTTAYPSYTSEKGRELLREETKILSPTYLVPLLQTILSHIHGMEDIENVRKFQKVFVKTIQHVLGEELSPVVLELDNSTDRLNKNISIRDLERTGALYTQSFKTMLFISEKLCKDSPTIPRYYQKTIDAINALFYVNVIDAEALNKMNAVVQCISEWSSPYRDGLQLFKECKSVLSNFIEMLTEYLDDRECTKGTAIKIMYFLESIRALYPTYSFGDPATREIGRCQEKLREKGIYPWEMHTVQTMEDEFNYSVDEKLPKETADALIDLLCDRYLMNTTGKYTVNLDFVDHLLNNIKNIKLIIRTVDGNGVESRENISSTMLISFLECIQNNSALSKEDKFDILNLIQKHFCIEGSHYLGIYSFILKEENNTFDEMGVARKILSLFGFISSDYIGSKEYSFAKFSVVNLLDEENRLTECSRNDLIKLEERVDQDGFLNLSQLSNNLGTRVNTAEILTKLLEAYTSLDEGEDKALLLSVLTLLAESEALPSNSHYTVMYNLQQLLKGEDIDVVQNINSAMSFIVEDLSEGENLFERNAEIEVLVQEMDALFESSDSIVNIDIKLFQKLLENIVALSNEHIGILYSGIEKLIDFSSKIWNSSNANINGLLNPAQEVLVTLSAKFTEMKKAIEELSLNISQCISNQNEDDFINAALLITNISKYSIPENIIFRNISGVSIRELSTITLAAALNGTIGNNNTNAQFQGNDFWIQSIIPDESSILYSIGDFNSYNKFINGPTSSPVQRMHEYVNTPLHPLGSSIFMLMESKKECASLEVGVVKDLLKTQEGISSYSDAQELLLENVLELHDILTLEEKEYILQSLIKVYLDLLQKDDKEQGIDDSRNLIYIMLEYYLFMLDNQDRETWKKIVRNVCGIEYSFYAETIQYAKLNYQNAVQKGEIEDKNEYPYSQNKEIAAIQRVLEKEFNEDIIEPTDAEQVKLTIRACLDSIYTGDIASVESKDPIVYLGTLQVLSIFLKRLDSSVKRAVYETSLPFMLNSLTQIGLRLKEFYPQHKDFADTFLKQLYQLSSVIYDVDVTYPSGIVMGARSVFIQNTIQSILNIFSKSWYTVFGELDTEIYSELDTILKRLKDIDPVKECSKELLSSIVSISTKILFIVENRFMRDSGEIDNRLSNFLLTCSDIIASYVAEYEDELSSSDKKNLEKFSAKLYEVCSNEVDGSKIFLKTVINKINSFDIDLQMGDIQKFSKKLRVLRVFLEAFDTEILGKSNIRLLARKLINGDLLNNVYLEPEIRKILHAIFPLLDVLSHRETLESIQNILFTEENRPYPFYDVTSENLKAYAVSQDDIRRYVNYYCGQYMYAKNGSEYAKGSLAHLLGIADELNLYSQEAKGSGHPSIFSASSEVVCSIQEYLLNNIDRIDKKVLEKAFQELVHITSSAEYQDTQVALYGESRFFSTTRDKSVFEDGSIQDNYSTTYEPSYNNVITKNFHKLFVKIYPTKAMSEEVYLLLHSFYCIACEVKSDMDFVESVKVMKIVNLLAKDISNKDVIGKVLPFINKKPVEELLFDLVYARENRGINLTNVNTIIQCCEDILNRMSLQEVVSGEKRSLAVQTDITATVTGVQDKQLPVLQDWRIGITSEVINSIMDEEYIVQGILKVEKLLQNYLDAYLPVNTTVVPEDFIDHIFSQIKEINEPVDYNDTIITPYTPWLECIIRHVATLENVNIRRSIANQIDRILFREDWEHSLRSEWRIELRYAEGTVVEHEGRVFNEFCEMFKEFCETSRNLVSKVGVSSNSSIAVVHTTFTNLAKDLAKAKELVQEGASGETLPNRLILLTYLNSIAKAFSNEAVICGMRATPGVNGIINDIVDSVKVLATKVCARHDIEILRAITDMVQFIAPTVSITTENINETLDIVDGRRFVMRSRFDRSDALEEIYTELLNNGFRNVDLERIVEDFMCEYNISIHNNFSSLEEETAIDALVHLTYDMLNLDILPYNCESIKSTRHASGKEHFPTCTTMGLEIILMAIGKLEDVQFSQKCLAMVKAICTYKENRMNLAFVHTDRDEDCLDKTQNRNQDLYRLGLENTLKIMGDIFSSSHNEYLDNKEKLQRELTAVGDIILEEGDLSALIRRMSAINIIIGETPVDYREIFLLADGKEIFEKSVEMLDENSDDISENDKSVVRTYLDNWYVHYPVYTEFSRGSAYQTTIQPLYKKIFGDGDSGAEEVSRIGTCLTTAIHKMLGEENSKENRSNVNQFIGELSNAVSQYGIVPEHQKIFDEIKPYLLGNSFQNLSELNTNVMGRVVETLKDTGIITEDKLDAIMNFIKFYKEELPGIIEAKKEQIISRLEDSCVEVCKNFNGNTENYFNDRISVIISLSEEGLLEDNDTDKIGDIFVGLAHSLRERGALFNQKICIHEGIVQLLNNGVLEQSAYSRINTILQSVQIIQEDDEEYEIPPGDDYSIPTTEISLKIGIFKTILQSFVANINQGIPSTAQERIPLVKNAEYVANTVINSGNEQEVKECIEVLETLETSLNKVSIDEGACLKSIVLKYDRILPKSVKDRILVAIEVAIIKGVDNKKTLRVAGYNLPFTNSSFSIQALETIISKIIASTATSEDLQSAQTSIILLKQQLTDMERIACKDILTATQKDVEKGIGKEQGMELKAIVIGLKDIVPEDVEAVIVAIDKGIAGASGGDDPKKPDDDKNIPDPEMTADAVDRQNRIKRERMKELMQSFLALGRTAEAISEEVITTFTTKMEEELANVQSPEDASYQEAVEQIRSALSRINTLLLEVFPKEQLPLRTTNVLLTVSTAVNVICNEGVSDEILGFGDIIKNMVKRVSILFKKASEEQLLLLKDLLEALRNNFKYTKETKGEILDALYSIKAQLLVFEAMKGREQFVNFIKELIDPKSVLSADKIAEGTRLLLIISKVKKESEIKDIFNQTLKMLLDSERIRKIIKSDDNTIGEALEFIDITNEPLVANILIFFKSLSNMLSGENRNLVESIISKISQKLVGENNASIQESIQKIYQLLSRKTVLQSNVTKEKLTEEKKELQILLKELRDKIEVEEKKVTSGKILRLSVDHKEIPKSKKDTYIFVKGEARNKIETLLFSIEQSIKDITEKNLKEGRPIEGEGEPLFNNFSEYLNTLTLYGDLYLDPTINIVQTRLRNHYFLSYIGLLGEIAAKMDDDDYSVCIKDIQEIYEICEKCYRGLFSGAERKRWNEVLDLLLLSKGMQELVQEGEEDLLEALRNLLEDLAKRMQISQLAQDTLRAVLAGLQDKLLIELVLTVKVCLYNEEDDVRDCIQKIQSYKKKLEEQGEDGILLDREQVLYHIGNVHKVGRKIVNGEDTDEIANFKRILEELSTIPGLGIQSSFYQQIERNTPILNKIKKIQEVMEDNSTYLDKYKDFLNIQDIKKGIEEEILGMRSVIFGGKIQKLLLAIDNRIDIIENYGELNELKLIDLILNNMDDIQGLYISEKVKALQMSVQKKIQKIVLNTLQDNINKIIEIDRNVYGEDIKHINNIIGELIVYGNEETKAQAIDMVIDLVESDEVKTRIVQEGDREVKEQMHLLLQKILELPIDERVNALIQTMMQELGTERVLLEEMLASIGRFVGTLRGCDFSKKVDTSILKDLINNLVVQLANITLEERGAIINSQENEDLIKVLNDALVQASSSSEGLRELGEIIKELQSVPAIGGMPILQKNINEIAKLLAKLQEEKEAQHVAYRALSKVSTLFSAVRQELSEIEEGILISEVKDSITGSQQTLYLYKDIHRETQIFIDSLQKQTITMATYDYFRRANTYIDVLLKLSSWDAPSLGMLKNAMDYVTGQLTTINNRMNTVMQRIIAKLENITVDSNPEIVFELVKDLQNNRATLTEGVIERHKGTMVTQVERLIRPQNWFRFTQDTINSYIALLRAMKSFVGNDVKAMIEDHIARVNLEREDFLKMEKLMVQIETLIKKQNKQHEPRIRELQSRIEEWVGQLNAEDRNRAQITNLERRLASAIEELEKRKKEERGKPEPITGTGAWVKMNFNTREPGLFINKRVLQEAYTKGELLQLFRKILQGYQPTTMEIMNIGILAQIKRELSEIPALDANVWMGVFIAEAVVATEDIQDANAKKQQAKALETYCNNAGITTKNPHIVFKGNAISSGLNKYLLKEESHSQIADSIMASLRCMTIEEGVLRTQRLDAMMQCIADAFHNMREEAREGASAVSPYTEASFTDVTVGTRWKNLEDTRRVFKEKKLRENVGVNVFTDIFPLTLSQLISKFYTESRGFVYTGSLSQGEMQVLGHDIQHFFSNTSFLPAIQSTCNLFLRLISNRGQGEDLILSAAGEYLIRVAQSVDSKEMTHDEKFALIELLKNIVNREPYDATLCAIFMGEHTSSASAPREGYFGQLLEILLDTIITEKGKENREYIEMLEELHKYLGEAGSNLSNKMSMEEGLHEYTASTLQKYRYQLKEKIKSLLDRVKK